MRKRLWIVHWIALVVFGVVAVSQGAVVLLSDDFERYQPGEEVVWGEMPVQFPLEGHFPAVVTEETSASGGQSVLLDHIPNDLSGNIGGYLYKQFAPQKQVTVTFWVWVSGPGRAFTLSMGSIPADGNGGPGGAKTGVSLYFNNGNVQGYANGWQNTGYAYPLSRWFQMRVEVDTARQNYRVFVRESATASWFDVGTIPFRNAVEEIEFVTFANYQSPPRSVVFYLDDVVITSGGN